MPLVLSAIATEGYRDDNMISNVLTFEEFLGLAKNIGYDGVHMRASLAGLQTSGFSAAATLRARNPHEAGDDRGLPMKDLYRALMPMAAPCKDGFVTFSFVGYALGEQSFEKTLTWMLAEGWQLPVTENKPVSTWRQKLEAGTLPAATVTALVEQLRAFLLTRTKAELMQFALTEKVLMAPSSTITDLLADVQLQTRGAFIELNGLKSPGAPFKLSRTPLTTAPTNQA